MPQENKREKLLRETIAAEEKRIGGKLSERRVNALRHEIAIHEQAERELRADGFNVSDAISEELDPT